MQPPAHSPISAESIALINKAVQAGLTTLQKPLPLTLSQWADEHFYLVEESSNIEGPWETLPYQKAIMNAISNDDIAIVDWMKSARVGYTKIICAAIGYFAEHKKRNQALWQPTDSDRDDFVKDEIDPLLRDVQIIRDLLKASPEKKSKYNTLSKKMFKGSTLDLKGGKSARNYRRMSKDVAYYDELDGFDIDIEGEGAPTSLGDMRIKNSSFPKSIRGSTPKTKLESQIENSLLQADMIFYRYLPCPHCNEYQKLQWSNIKWINNDPKTAQYACIECGALIDYSQYPDMDAQGIWKTDEGIYIDPDEFFRDINDKIIDPPRHIGFHIWAAYSYFTTWPQIVEEFLKANARKKRGDIGPLKTFVNTFLGETWEDEGETIDDASLLARREPYSAAVPEPVLLLTCGVDVQADRIEAEVMGWLEGDENYGIEYAIFWGDPKQPAVWDDLDTFLTKIYDHESGDKMPISITCIDTGYLATNAVYDFVAKRQSRRIYGTKGVPGDGRPIISAPARKRAGRNPVPIKLFTIGTDAAKTVIYAFLSVDRPGPGYSHFPQAYQPEFFEQVTAEKVVTKYKRGFPYREWVKTRPRNEALDIRVLNLAAKLLFNPQYETLRRKKSQPPRPKPQPESQPQGFIKRKEGSFFKRR